MLDDNEKPATKADISLLRAEVATKTELAGVKTDISLLMTDMADVKTDITRLDKKIDRVAVEVVKTQGQMQQMEERLNAKMDTRFNQVLSAIDTFAKKSEINGNAVVLHGRALTDVQVGLKDHEGRLKTLESTRP